ncbi:MAG TPA: ferric reductase-like transmembrane domain-containing protein [Patescibacteria group bacterium]|nr:ferric reductase-like transmembrane domain-containing protein [Patescibacteria group bacterium]
MTAIGLSGDVGLIAISLLTLNILLGLLIPVRYSPWRYWPHRRINIFWVHNQTGLLALGVAVLHPVILLFSRTAGFHWLDVVFPAWSPKQPTVNLIGAAALYTLAFVLITSHYRVQLGRRTWKTLHFTTYLVAAFAFAHSVLTDPHLRGGPVDYFGGGKVFAEICLLIVLAATFLRVRYAMRKTRSGQFAREGAPQGTL